MRAHAQLVVDRVAARVLRCEAPLALRVCPDATYLVSSAAGPIGGDDLRLDVVAEQGAALVVRSTAASIALPGSNGARSRVRINAYVADGATLAWRPEPLIATSRCRHVTDAHVRLEPAASVRWRDELVLGRAGEAAGECRVRLRVDRGDVPLLRHDLLVGTNELPGEAATGGARVIGTLLVAGALTVTPSAGFERRSDLELAVLPLDRDGVLVTALGNDARTVRAALDDADERLVERSG